MQPGSGNSILLCDDPFNVLGCHSSHSPRYRMNSNACYNVFTMTPDSFGNFHENIIKPFVLALFIDLKYDHFLFLPQPEIGTENCQFLSKISDKLWKHYFERAVPHLLFDFKREEIELQQVCENFLKMIDINIKIDVKGIKEQAQAEMKPIPA